MVLEQADIHEVPETQFGLDQGHLVDGFDCPCRPQVFRRYIHGTPTGLTYRHNMSVNQPVTRTYTTESTQTLFYLSSEEDDQN